MTDQEQIQRELRRRTIRPFLRSRIIITLLVPFALLIHGIAGFGAGIMAGVREFLIAWDALG